MERIQKVIANSGYCSRRKAEELIKQGKVTLNGEKVIELGVKASSKDEILVEGNAISKQEKEYYIFNKPRGVICSTKDDKGRKTVLDFFNENKNIYPIGRLDYDTTGLLLLTNDGEFANLMMHPKSNIQKLYIAKLKGIITGKDIQTLKKGIIIDQKKCVPDRVKLKKVNKASNTCIVEIIIHDGKNHEVKKMFESVGYETLKLKREMYGFLTLVGLAPSKYRKLTSKEVKKLYALANSK